MLQPAFKESVSVQKLTKAGRVYLPVSARNALDLKEKDKVGVWFDDEEGNIILKPISRSDEH